MVERLRYSIAFTVLLWASGASFAASIPPPADPFVVVLGIAQDGGVPQAGCRKECCASGIRRLVSSLALVDPQTGERWLFDATPDFPEQLRRLDSIEAPLLARWLTGVFVSHAHIGHYTGLMFLGREVMGTSGVPVFALPRMYDFLNKNGPWDQLVRLGNISLVRLEAGVPVRLNERLAVTPILVPHRDEYSETAGFRIQGPQKAVLFIPDIDKWERWDRRIEQFVAGVDAAYIDGTFFADGEIPGRNMSEIPHPFIEETMLRLKDLPAEQKARVHFIHLNHTNPALVSGGSARQAIERAGYHVAEELERFGL
ncbi:MAG: MBL fold metallo-hydrolase [Acidobacteria bacterium]|nr:MBL fold metallo-hydrolase [Acidobacteriota bacterium]